MDLVKNEMALVKNDITILKLNIQGKETDITLGPVIFWLGVAILLLAALFKDYTTVIATIGIIVILASMIIFKYKPNIVR